MQQNGVPVACGYVVEGEGMMLTPTTHGIVGEVPQSLQAMVEKLAEQLVSSQKNEIATLNKCMLQ